MTPTSFFHPGFKQQERLDHDAVPVCACLNSNMFHLSRLSHYASRGRRPRSFANFVKILAAAALAACFSGSQARAQAPAGSVDVSFNNSNLVFATTEFGGTPLADGSIVRVGTFQDGLTTNRTTLETSNNFSELDALFTPLAEGILNAGVRLQTPTILPIDPTGALTVNSGDLGAPGGSMFMTVSGYSNSYLALGSQLYLWAFNTGDLGNVQSGDWGIFASEGNPLWLLPGEDVLDTTTLSGSAAFSPFLLTALRGSVDTGGGMALLNAPVPEPTPAFLGIISALIATSISRRRHHQ